MNGDMVFLDGSSPLPPTRLWITVVYEVKWRYLERILSAFLYVIQLHVKLNLEKSNENTQLFLLFGILLGLYWNLHKKPKKM